MTEWTVEKYAIINDLKDKNDFKALITYDALFSLGINYYHGYAMVSYCRLLFSETLYLLVCIHITTLTVEH
jgi:hypothetical protein